MPRELLLMPQLTGSSSRPQPFDECNPCPEYCPLCDHHPMQCEKCINHYAFRHEHQTREEIIAEDGRKVAVIASHSWSYLQ